MAHRIHKTVDLFFRVVEVQACPRGGTDAEALHQRLCTVMAGADADVLTVQDGRHIVRMNSLNVEGDNAAVTVRIRFRKRSPPE